MTDASTTLGAALAQHYMEHGLPPDGGEHQPSFRVRIGPLVLTLPNPPARQRAVFFHDSNHVLTGYNTVFSDGEMVIAGFELGSGCGRYWIAWLINLSMFGLGLVACPRPMFTAFVRGRRASSLYRRSEDRATLSAMTVAQVKTLTGIGDFPLEATWADRVAFTGLALVLAAGVLGVVLALSIGIRRVAALH